MMHNIQAMRAIAALMVVLCHLIPIENKYAGTPPILPDFLSHGKMGVDLFFVISGIVMVTITRNQFSRSGYPLNFIYRRTARIYPTYWFYTLLLLPVFFIKPEWINSAQGNQADLLASFLLLPSDFLPLVGVAWTLIHEMYFYLVFFIFLSALNEKHLPAALLIWGILVTVITLTVKTSNPTILLVSHPLTLEFIAGCYIALFFRRATTKHVCIVIIFLILAWALLCYFYLISKSTPLHPESENWWRVALYGIPSATLVIMAIFAENKGHIFHSALVSLGNTSYSMYLCHILVLSALGRVWLHFSTPSALDNFLFLSTLTISVILASIISYKYIELPLLNISQKIIKNKNL